MRQDEPELHTLHYQAWQSLALYINIHFSVSLPTQCQSQAVVRVRSPKMYPECGRFLVVDIMRVDPQAFQKNQKPHFIRDIQKSFQEVTPIGPEPHQFFSF